MLEGGMVVSIKKAAISIIIDQNQAMNGSLNLQ